MACFFRHKGGPNIGSDVWAGFDPGGPILVRTRPPSTYPKMVVQDNGFCGRQRRRRFCFRHMAGGNIFVRPYVFVLEILRILWRIQKWLKSAKKGF